MLQGKLVIEVAKETADFPHVDGAFMRIEGQATFDDFAKQFVLPGDGQADTPRDPGMGLHFFEVGIHVGANRDSRLVCDFLAMMFQEMHSTREIAVDEMIGNKPEAVDVPFLGSTFIPVLSAADELFRRSVEDRVTEIDMVDFADETRRKVENDGVELLLLFPNPNRSRVEVAMNDPVLVGMTECVCDSADDFPGLRFLERPDFFERFSTHFLQQGCRG